MKALLLITAIFSLIGNIGSVDAQVEPHVSNTYYGVAVAPEFNPESDLGRAIKINGDGRNYWINDSGGEGWSLGQWVQVPNMNDTYATYWATSIPDQRIINLLFNTTEEPKWTVVEVDCRTETFTLKLFTFYNVRGERERGDFPSEALSQSTQDRFLQSLLDGVCLLGQ